MDEIITHLKQAERLAKKGDADGATEAISKAYESFAFHRRAVIKIYQDLGKSPTLEEPWKLAWDAIAEAREERDNV